jgi:Na+/H+-dicarboxylate symporter
MIEFFVGFWVGLIVGIFIPILVFILLARKPSLLLRLFLRVANVAKIPPELLAFLTGLAMLKKEDKKGQD